MINIPLYKSGRSYFLTIFACRYDSVQIHNKINASKCDLEDVIYGYYHGYLFSSDFTYTLYLLLTDEEFESEKSPRPFTTLEYLSSPP